MCWTLIETFFCKNQTNRPPGMNYNDRGEIFLVKALSRNGKFASRDKIFNDNCKRVCSILTRFCSQ